MSVRNELAMCGLAYHSPDGREKLDISLAPQSTLLYLPERRMIVLNLV